jgi:hypothetical protein
MSLTAMSSTQSTLSSEQSLSGLNYEEIKSFLECSCGSIDDHSEMMPWDDFWQIVDSKASSTTPTTKSSSVTKYSPTHYKRGTIEVWDFIVDQNLDYLAGNVIKYVCRAGHKSHESELDDWLKVKAYVERKIQQVSHERNR